MLFLYFQFVLLKLLITSRFSLGSYITFIIFDIIFLSQIGFFRIEIVLIIIVDILSLINLKIFKNYIKSKPKPTIAKSSIIPLQPIQNCNTFQNSNFINNGDSLMMSERRSNFEMKTGKFNSNFSENKDLSIINLPVKEVIDEDDELDQDD